VNQILNVILHIALLLTCVNLLVLLTRTLLMTLAAIVKPIQTVHPIIV
jgi:hypothetical protein